MERWNRGSLVASHQPGMSSRAAGEQLVARQAMGCCRTATYLSAGEVVAAVPLTVLPVYLPSFGSLFRLSQRARLE